MRTHSGNSHRPERIASVIKRSLSVIIDTELDDPHIHGVSVVEVEMSRDYKYATVFVAVDDNDELVVKTLNKCSAYIRRLLAEENIEMRGIPRLNFVIDKSQSYYNRIEEVIRGLHHGSEDE